MEYNFNNCKSLCCTPVTYNTVYQLYFNLKIMIKGKIKSINFKKRKEKNTRKKEQEKPSWLRALSSTRIIPSACIWSVSVLFQITFLLNHIPLNLPSNVVFQVMFLFFFNWSITAYSVVLFLLYSEVNQSCVYTQPLPPGPSSHPVPHPTRSGHHEHTAELPVLYSKVPLAICFTRGSVYMSFVWFICFVLLLFHNLFHPPLPLNHPPLCPQSQIWQFRCMGFIKGCSQERGTERRRMRQGIEVRCRQEGE